MALCVVLGRSGHIVWGDGGGSWQGDVTLGDRDRRSLLTLYYLILAEGNSDRRQTVNNN